MTYRDKASYASSLSCTKASYVSSLSSTCIFAILYLRKQMQHRMEQIAKIFAILYLRKQMQNMSIYETYTCEN